MYCYLTRKDKVTHQKDTDMERTLLSVLVLALSVTMAACLQNNENEKTQQPETEESAAPHMAQAIIA